jgi:hypothetical protein
MKKPLKPFYVHYKFNGLPRHDVILAFSKCHAVQVLIRFFESEVVKSPDCLTDFEVSLIPHLR